MQLETLRAKLDELERYIQSVWSPSFLDQNPHGSIPFQSPGTNAPEVKEQSVASLSLFERVARLFRGN
jgi:hypothetical protein